MTRNRALLLILGLSCAACGSKRSNDFSAFHGIYTVDAQTWNRTGCDAEGGAVTGGATLMVLYTASYNDCAEVRPCGDIAGCRDQAATEGPTPMGSSDFAAEFDRITTDGQGLMGTSPEVVSDQTAHVTENLLTKNGDHVRIEMRTHVLTCVVRGTKCDATATVAAAATVPCSQLRVASATFVQGL